VTSEPLADVAVVDTELFGAPGLHAAYLLTEPAPVLVDAGAAPAVGPVTETLREYGVGPDDLAAIVVTHVHLDHAGAAGALAATYPNATVYVHEAGVEYLTDDSRLERLVESARDAVGDAVAAAYGDPNPVPAERTVAVGDGDAIPVGDGGASPGDDCDGDAIPVEDPEDGTATQFDEPNREEPRTLEVVHAPGHAPHQIALVDSRTGALFAADAAGMSLDGDLLPTTPAPDFDLDASLDTIDRLRARDPTAICYAHFGIRHDAAAALDAYADLLPAWVAAVEDALDDPAVDTREALVTSLREDWASPTLERDLQGVLHALDASL
jgi:glyoxylase-like metal-dependent hydrolase (beta-lactamase superfamily II)